MRAAEQWWEGSSYLEDVALVFAAITVVNSGMMVAGWDTPKTGTFAYTHLLGRLAIVAAVVTLFHLDDLQKHIKRRVRDRRERLPTTDTTRHEPAVELLLRQFSRAPLGRAAAAFTVVTAVLCLVAITSSMWWEPQGGVLLYRALLVLAAFLAVLVGGLTWWHRSRPASSDGSPDDHGSTTPPRIGTSGTYPTDPGRRRSR